MQDYRTEAPLPSPVRVGRFIFWRMTGLGVGHVGKNKREKDLIKCFVNDNANAVLR